MKTDGTYKVMEIDNSAITNEINLVAAAVDTLSDTVEALDPTDFTGYDATKTQTLKNVSGTLTWVDDE